MSSGDSGDTLRPVCLRSLLFDSVDDEVLLLLDFVVRRLVGFDDDDDGDTVEGLAWKIGSDPSTAAEDDDNGDGERVSMDNDGDSPILVWSDGAVEGKEVVT